LVHERETDDDVCSNKNTRKEIVAQLYELDHPGEPAPRDPEPKATTTGEDVSREPWQSGPKHADPECPNAVATYRRLINAKNLPRDHQRMRKEFLLKASKYYIAQFTIRSRPIGCS
jgi:hypothetical protein